MQSFPGMWSQISSTIWFLQIFRDFCKKKTKICIKMLNFSLKLQIFPSKSKFSREWDYQIPHFFHACNVWPSSMISWRLHGSASNILSGWCRSINEWQASHVLFSVLFLNMFLYLFCISVVFFLKILYLSYLRNYTVSVIFNPR